MKRIASGLLALALTVMPAAAFADEGTGTTTTPGTTTGTEQSATTSPDQNQNNGQTQNPEQGATQPGSGDQKTQTPNQDTTTQPNNGQNSGDQKPSTGEQKQEVEIVVDPKLIDMLEVEGEYGYALDLRAELKDVSQASGTWTVEVVGGLKNDFKEGKVLDKSISLGTGKHFTVNIQFTGTADGKEVSGKKTVEVNIPDFKVDYKATGGKHELSGKLENVKSAKGDWYFGVGYVDSENALDEKFYDGVEGLSLSHSFDLKPGEYVGVVAFKGYVDGVYMVLYDMVEFEVKEDGKGEVKEPSDDKDKSPVVNPDEGEKILDEAKKGGKLPKTATAYPTGAVAGLALLAGGLALLKLRRTA
jgi:hypothetical protein